MQYLSIQRDTERRDVACAVARPFPDLQSALLSQLRVFLLVILLLLLLLLLNLILILILLLILVLIPILLLILLPILLLLLIPLPIFFPPFTRPHPAGDRRAGRGGFWLRPRGGTPVPYRPPKMSIVP